MKRLIIIGVILLGMRTLPPACARSGTDMPDA
jgi:hypothetical protein